MPILRAPTSSTLLHGANESASSFNVSDLSSESDDRKQSGVEAALARAEKMRSARLQMETRQRNRFTERKIRQEQNKLEEEKEALREKESKKVTFAAPSYQDTLARLRQEHDVERKALQSKVRLQKMRAKAATDIARCMRGWWTRLEFKILKLEHCLSPDRTREALEQVQEDLLLRKEAYRQKIEQDMLKLHKKEGKREQKLQTAQALVGHLRRENKRIRESIQQFHSDIKEIKKSNDLLESLNEEAYKNLKIIQDRFETDKLINAKLLSVLPSYFEAVEKHKQALEKQTDYYKSEQRVKCSVIQCLASLAQTVDENCRDPSLVDEIMLMCEDVVADKDLRKDASESSSRDDDDASSCCSADESESAHLCAE